ncbi:cysteine desulfurase family protein [Dichotomicrobium thermohalophilum]|uniref:Cysteine desulfurase n=1 Tax=Dichotomicrobium thermohalophilum TaxID=933063 RepID=A0A397Q5D4_9HYPH|nr:cysteine desulfurase family protein [Dichotomicrobium thermohalophilum]RIA56690.1 cysteine desulfurase [Dichotomicrobium thermohalophilum]
MIRARCYFDHNASSPLRPEAREAMMRAFDLVGNASSVHAEGRAARAAIEDAREQVARLCGADTAQVVFTSGGTESNVLALAPEWLSKLPGYAPEKARLFTSAIEHPSAYQGGGFDAQQITRLPVTADGVVDLDAAKELISRGDGAPFMVSVMSANNETGAIQPTAELGEIVRAAGGILHCDAVQSVGRVPMDVSALGADLVSVSAHKFGGPKGAGALIIVRDELHNPVPVMHGGGQERGRRAGTENFPAIAGFGAAAEAVQRDLQTGDGIGAVQPLRDRLERELKRIAADAWIAAENASRLPNTTCVAVPGLHGETLVIAMDLEGIAVSAGSACSSGKVERSHVLDAMGLDNETASGAIRISLGWSSTDAEVERFLSAWQAIYERRKHESAAA